MNMQQRGRRNRGTGMEARKQEERQGEELRGCIYPP
jgi:hypothetical protein